MNYYRILNKRCQEEFCEEFCGALISFACIEMMHLEAKFKNHDFRKYSLTGSW